MTSFSVPQRCPNCGSIRTLPYYGSEDFYESVWKKMERAEQLETERIKRLEDKKKAIDLEERKRREEIILAGPTWFPPGTPLRIEES